MQLLRRWLLRLRRWCPVRRLRLQGYGYVRKAYDYKPAYKASYEPTYSAPAYKPAHY